MRNKHDQRLPEAGMSDQNLCIEFVDIKLEAHSIHSKMNFGATYGRKEIGFL
jgi:hypothetical protein